MSDINDATRYMDEDGLLTLADRIEDVFAKKTDVSKSIQATYEQSPTLAAHASDEYLYIKTGSSTHVTYKTLTSIAANTELVVGTNVKVFDDTGIPVYVDKVPGAGGGGVQPILRTEYVGTSTRSDQTIDKDRIIYYINKFYKVVKNGGLPASYTVVPATDLEAVSLGTDIPVSVERMPAGAVITAADISYDDGTVDDALTELNSNLALRDIISSFNVNDSYCSIQSASYRNGVVCINGTVNANVANGTILFGIPVDSNYRPVSNVKAVTTRSGSYGVINLDSELGRATYYCDTTFASAQQFTITYISKG